jgi:hypothetical protein
MRFLIEVMVEIVVRRLPVRVMTMSGGGTATPQEARAAAGVEHPRGQCHVASAANGVTLADQHRNQHKEPEHDEGDPQEGLGDAWHVACSFPLQARSVTSASMDGAPKSITHL